MSEHEVLSIGSETWERASSLYVRYQVFVLERGIAKEDEFDHQDIEGRVYANLFVGEEPVSTGRFLPVGPGQARLTRIATLAKYRGKGYGKMILNSLEVYARQAGFQQLDIHSELTAKTFYESLGYQASSEMYQEDGEWCQTLTKLI
ncbi:TPA: GNAT family N-acetyltransferase [Streptococcus suis]|nr:GNAT family N-acetyltransferase [Streptococcus suis]